MEYTESQKEEFKRQFAARRRKQLIVTGLFLALIILAALTRESPALAALVGAIPTSIFVPVAVLVITGMMVFSIRNWRCPACNRYLGRTLNPNFCPKCGVALR